MRLSVATLPRNAAVWSRGFAIIRLVAPCRSGICALSPYLPVPPTLRSSSPMVGYVAPCLRRSRARIRPACLGHGRPGGSDDVPAGTRRIG